MTTKIPSPLTPNGQRLALDALVKLGDSTPDETLGVILTEAKALGRHAVGFCDVVADSPKAKTLAFHASIAAAAAYARANRSKFVHATFGELLAVLSDPENFSTPVLDDLDETANSGRA